MSAGDDRLGAFAAEMFASLSRCDQRARGEQYVRGLLLEGGERKSIEGMAARLCDGNAQGLQQFITDSPWRDAPVRRRSASAVTEAISPDAWVVRDVELPRSGARLPGVARQFCRTLGRRGNCQAFVCVSAAGARTSCPLGWRLMLPPVWDRDTERRRRARIPDSLRSRPRWRLALEIIDELLAWGLRPPVVHAGPDHGSVAAFRDGLRERGLGYLVRCTRSTSVRTVGPQGAAEWVEARELAERCPPPAPPGRQARRLTSVRVWGDDAAAGVGEPDHWLLARWPYAHAREPTDYWLSNIPGEVSLGAVARHDRLARSVERDARELHTLFELGRYEGRTYPGLQHHLACVTVAHAFVTCCRLGALP